MAKTNYNITTVERNGEIYHFITRGRSRPFSDSEVKYFFSNVSDIDSKFIVQPHLKRQFFKDLQLGLNHCAKKYGASELKIRAEAERLFPQQNLDRIIGAIAK